MYQKRCHSSPARHGWRGRLSAGALMLWLLSVPGWASSGAAVPAAQVRALLSEAMMHAIDHGTVAAQAQARMRAADSDLEEARARRWPQFDVGVRSALSNTQANGMAGGVRHPVPTAMATAVLFDWGRTDALIAGGEHGVWLARHRYDVAIAGLAYDTCAAVIAMARQQQLHALAQTYVQRMAALVELLVQIVEVDRGRASELLQARARLAQARALRDQVQARVQETRIALARLTGPREIDLPAGADWQIDLPTLEQLLGAVPVHPAVHQAEAEGGMSQASADALAATAWPPLVLSVGRTLGPDSGGRPGGWQVQLSANLALGQGGAVQSAVNAARERARAEGLRREQAVLEQEFIVRSAHHAIFAAQARAKAADQVSLELEQVRDMFMQQWLRLGRRSLLDVLNAQSDHHANQAGALASRFDSYESTLRAYAGAGQLVPWLRGDMRAQ